MQVVKSSYYYCYYCYYCYYYCYYKYYYFCYCYYYYYCYYCYYYKYYYFYYYYYCNAYYFYYSDNAEDDVRFIRATPRNKQQGGLLRSVDYGCGKDARLCSNLVEQES